MKAGVIIPYKPTCGGVTKSLYKFADKEYPYQYSNLVVQEDIQSIDENVGLWKNDFESVGVPFFNAYSDLNGLDQLFNEMLTDKSVWVDLNVVNRIVKGIAVNYLVKKDSKTSLQLCNKHKSVVKDKTSDLYIYLNTLEEYLKNS